MGAGLQVWDASGNLIFDTPDRVGRIVGSTTTSGSAGSVTFTVPSGCTPFWFASCATGAAGMSNFSISGGTISWGVGVVTTLFYGYY